MVELKNMPGNYIQCSYVLFGNHLGAGPSMAVNLGAKRFLKPKGTANFKP